MARTAGERTKARILRAAEELFAKNGFDGTSVDEIARSAAVNKALIYYHFKDKNDLVASLFASMIQEVEEHLRAPVKGKEPDDGLDLMAKIKEEIKFMAKRKEIIAVLLMESFKSGDKAPPLFKCSKLIMKHASPDFVGEAGGEHSAKTQRFMVQEFFTGIIPMMVFAALQDKWAEYLDSDSDKMLEYFADCFVQSHLSLRHDGA